MNTPDQHEVVCLITGREVESADEIRRGVWRYSEPTRLWRQMGRQAVPQIIEQLHREGITGVICQSWQRSVIRSLNRIDIPVVLVGGSWKARNAALVRFDERACGEAAAMHLLKLGFKHFACAAVAWPPPCRVRSVGFIRALRRHGREPNVLLLDRVRAADGTRASLLEQPEQRVVAWINRLPKPVGMFVPSAGYATAMHDYLAVAGAQMPGDVALVAGHDTASLTEARMGGITAVRLPLAEAGYHAARAMDAVLSGRATLPPAPLKPLGVVARESTSRQPKLHDDVAKAAAFIRDFACHGITVDDVLDHVGVSRSWLDRIFRAEFGHTVFAEIRHVQIGAVRALLQTTDETLDNIARRTGFSHGFRLSTVFKQMTGQTPSAYRSSMRHSPDVLTQQR